MPKKYQRLLRNLYQRLNHIKSWDNFIKEESNKSQTEKRFRDASRAQLEQLSNLAELFPEYMQKEVYTSSRIEHFLMKLLNIREPFIGREYPRNLDTRRCQLASKMVELGTSFCISQFELMFSEHGALANPTIKHLKEAIAICKDIGNKIESDEQKSYAEDKKLEYLFNWNYVTTRDKNRFENFLSEVAGIQYPLALLDTKNKGPYALSCLVGDKELGIEIEVEIKLDTIHDIATVTTKDKERIKPIKLRLKTDGENIHVYRNRTQK
jgi:hypothetical protein